MKKLPEKIKGIITEGIYRKEELLSVEAGKINELIDYLTPEEKEVIQIIPSGRIDYCSDCGKDHGFDCPKDSPLPTVNELLKEYRELCCTFVSPWKELSQEEQVKITNRMQEIKSQLQVVDKK